MMTVRFSLRHVLPVLVMFVGSLVSGCGTDTDVSLPSAEISPERQTAIEMLSGLDEQRIRDVFQNLHRFTYKRDLEFSTVSNAGVNSVPYRLETRVSNSTVEILQESGLAENGLTRNGSEPESDFAQMDPSVAVDLVPDTTDYRPVRKQEQYRYQILPDTLIDGISLRVVELTANPTGGEQPNITRLRFYVSNANELRGVEVATHIVGFLYGEESSAKLVTTERSGTLLPFEMEYDVRIKVPFVSGRHLKMSVRYSDYIRN